MYNDKNERNISENGPIEKHGSIQSVNTDGKSADAEKHNVSSEKIIHGNSQHHQHSHDHQHHQHHHHHHHNTSKKALSWKEKLKKLLKKKNNRIAILSGVIAILLLIGAFVLENTLYADSETIFGRNNKLISEKNDLDTNTYNDIGSNQPLYSFGVLSDLHIQYGKSTYGGVADFQRALTYLKDRVSFTCISGDLVAWAGTGSVEYFGTKDYMAQYKACVDKYAGDMPVYECAGNHETYPAQGVTGTIDTDKWRETTGEELYYSFTYGNDVFIFLSLKGTNINDLFPAGGLEWLEVTLESNKNKRCFVFQHCPELADSTADPSGTWSDIMEGTSGKAFIALMKRYPNTIWFHGHTHVTLGVDEYPVSDVLGYKSIHVPSLGAPRFYDESDSTLKDYYYDRYGNKVWGSLLSEGYIVDVYENKIILRGINFAAGSNRNQVEEMDNEIYALNTVIRIKN